MHNAGGLKVAAKRTAFGDVSNTANVIRPSRDDLAIDAKSEYKVSEKPISFQDDRKPTSFLRPAQRPLSVSGLKGLLNGITHTTSQVPVKQPLVELPQASHLTTQVSNIRKVTKKSTIVLKDAPFSKIEQPISAAQKPLDSDAPIAPIHREPLAQIPNRIPDENSQSQVKSNGDQSEVQEQRIQEPESIAQPLVQASTEEITGLRSDGSYVDEQGRVQAYDYVDPTALAGIIAEEKEIIPAQETGRQVSTTSADISQHAQPPKPLSEPARRSSLAPVSEPEEYWDEEGEENYDEEGYVTARSFKSRGENTTGGATTILFPKVNQKVKKEIAIAKDLVEGSKTAEELEDEAWDTTMVAEYGDEIFQYMKDLEVRLMSS